MTDLTASARYESLRGRVVLVTGGASGIGRGIVVAFAGQGSRVAFLDRDEVAGRETVTLCGADAPLFLACDLRDVGELRAAVAEARRALGPVDVLINNAGNDDQHRTADLTPDDFDDRIAVNLRHMVFAVQAVAPDMQAAGGGSIVNLGSIAWRMADGSAPIYTACKAAVTGLTRAHAREYGASGIRVNAVLPGWVMTPRQRALWVDAEAEAQIDRSQCLPGRLAEDDIAAMVLFLASDQGRMCTAQDFIVDGGWV